MNLVAEEVDYHIFKDQGYQKLPASMQDEFQQYEAFRWAEGYFIYHLMHLYGIGMPKAPLPPRVSAGLERFGEKYGREEEKNRRKQMTAVFTGREKLNEIGAFIHDHEDELWRAFQVATVLDLNRTYKSSWFATLLGLLGVSVFLSAYRGWRFETRRSARALVWAVWVVVFLLCLRGFGALSLPWAPDMLGLMAAFFVGTWILGSGVPKKRVSLQKAGFFIVHNGLLVLLIGGATSKFTTERGILNLDSRDPTPKDVYYRFFDVHKKARLPFGVSLDRFGRKDWLALQVDFPNEEFTSRPPRYTLWPGRTIELDQVRDESGAERADLRIEVLEVYDHAEVGLVKVHESSDPDAEPLALAELLLDRGGQRSRFLLLPMEGDRARLQAEVLRDPGNAWRLAAANGSDPESHFPKARPGRERIGTIEWSIVGVGDGQPTAIPVVLGETVELGGGYSLTFRQATTDFRTGKDDDKESHHPLPLEKQPLGFAALWVDVQGPDGAEPERRVLFETIDDVQFGRQRGFFYSDVVLRFAYDYWSAPGPPRYVLHWEEHGKGELVMPDGSRVPTSDGQVLPLPGDAEVTVSQLLERADFESNLSFHNSEPDENGWNRAFYEPAHRGVVLRVTRHPGTPEEESQRVELATSQAGNANLWFSPDREVVLQFVENSEMMPFEWRSVLTLWDRDGAGGWKKVALGSEREREIRVNDYLYFRGYRFFQTNADPQVPTYSGIGVVYDPGIPIVLIGMYAIILGGAIAFLVRPAVKGWGTPPKGASA
ncbi:MAG TPA: hypothetical protein ENJ09_15875 [Planctomycetes bacterium]|nr:hypothetical protein [Planctomycetota bacterium]